jgi:hypothetical protein
MRAPDYHRWGANADGNNGNQGSSNAYRVFTRSIYATVTQDWGELSIGRLEENFPTAQAGLKTLGSTYGGDYIYTLPFDNSSVVDGISYTKKFDNGFGINAYYAKDVTDDTGPALGPDKDVDSDRFGVEPFYTWEGGGVAVNLEYVRDMTFDDDFLAYPDKQHAFFINPAIMQAWGPFSIKFEGKIGWGEATFPGDPVKYKSEGLGLYLEATYNYGAGDINLLAWFADGTALNENKSHNLVDMGDFAPFLVAYYGNTLGGRVSEVNNGVWGSAPYYASDFDRGVLAGGVNQWGIGILGNHSFTDAIKFNYGVGFFELVEELYIGQNKDLGVEIDVGVNIQLLDNLTFETQFGYMFSGKAYKNYVGLDGNGNEVFHDAKDTYAWLSALTFSF